MTLLSYTHQHQTIYVITLTNNSEECIKKQNTFIIGMKMNKWVTIEVKNEKYLAK